MTNNIDVENPVVIDSLWRKGQATYAWADDVPVKEFVFEVDMSGLSTLTYVELADAIDDIIRRSPENIITTNEGDLECVDDEQYPDELSYTDGAMLRIDGQVREEDFDDLEDELYCRNLKYRLVQ